MVTRMNEIYQIKVSLKGVKPPIWRRLLVPAKMTLPDFHEVIQTAMGWMNCHLHQFIVGNNRYGVCDPDWGDDEILDEENVRLSKLFHGESSKIQYEYDFGDGWEHEIVLEKIVDGTAEDMTPKCLKGKRACPPEDCGGSWGYANLLKVMSNPQDEEYEEMKEWLDVDFDPEYFDAEEVNQVLREEVIA